MRKNGDFEHGMVVGVSASSAALSISESANPLGFFPHNHLYSSQRMVQKKEIMSCELQAKMPY